jgi:hypothetical protein
MTKKTAFQLALEAAKKDLTVQLTAAKRWEERNTPFYSSQPEEEEKEDDLDLDS